MAELYRRTSVIITFSVLLVVLFANALTTWRQLAIQLQSEKWVSHTRSVLLQISETESLLKDVETARGAIFTVYLPNESDMDSTGLSSQATEAV